MKTTVSVAVAAIMAIGAMPAVAHHSFSMYDLSRTVRIEGEVVRYEWQNPHTHVHVKVLKADGLPASVKEFDVEGPAPNILSRQGWNKKTLQAGDRITLITHPMRSGSPEGSLVYAVKDGVVMYADAKRPDLQGRDEDRGRGKHDASVR